MSPPKSPSGGVGANPAAPQNLLSAVQKLFDIALKAQAPSQLQAMSQDKLYEMLVLTRVLRAFKRAYPQGQVIHVPPTKSGQGSANIVVACKPASADRVRFSHFDLYVSPNNLVAEVWTSVEFESLSWRVGNGQPGKAHRQARHELDVCVLLPNANIQPSHYEVLAGISCKDVRQATKENVREALGLRRETAFLAAPQPSSVAWLKSSVPADPPIPIFLASSDPSVIKYASPVDAMGVYVHYIRRPW